MASNDPVKVGCVNVPAAIVGTPAGHATVPAGVPALTADEVSNAPVNVSAGTVMDVDPDVRATPPNESGLKCVVLAA